MHLSNPDQTVTTRPLWRKLEQIIIAILATSGILVQPVTPLRVLVWGLIAANILFMYAFGHLITLDIAIGYFALMFVLRYAMLFGSFGKNGLAPRLTHRFGENRGYAIYEAMTAFMFYYRSISFNVLLEKTAATLPISVSWLPAVTVVAWAFMIVATVVNIWGTLIIGIDVYYYKDMFVRRAIGTFEVSGPFKYFSNPMYGIGQFNAYGLALLSGSLWGLLATALNQAFMYIFYFAYEKPHIKRLFGPAATQSPASIL